VHVLKRGDTQSSLVEAGHRGRKAASHEIVLVFEVQTGAYRAVFLAEFPTHFGKVGTKSQRDRAEVFVDELGVLELGDDFAGFVLGKEVV
jgi:hypothetical protein